MGLFQNATVTLKRAGSVVPGVPPIPMQIDALSAQEGAYYNAEQPFFKYALYTFGIFDIRQEDLLVDTAHIDPKTGTYTQYRVINDPPTEQFLTHMEIIADRYRGT